MPVTMTSVCQWLNGKSRCVCLGECVCMCHSSFSVSCWVQGACLDHISSIKVVSRRVSHETQNWEAQSGTVWPCGPSEGSLARVVSTTSRGLCQGAPGALSCRHLVNQFRMLLIIDNSFLSIGHPNSKHVDRHSTSYYHRPTWLATTASSLPWCGSWGVVGFIWWHGWR